MRDVYRIRLRRHETLGAKPPDDIDCIRPHTSITLRELDNSERARSLLPASLANSSLRQRQS